MKFEKALLLLGCFAMLSSSSAIAEDDVWATSASASAAKPLFDTNNLFAGDLFSKDDMATSLDAQIASTVKKEPKVDPAAQQVAAIQNQQVVEEMRSQMMRVARWLEVYGIRNTRFPGFQNDEMYAAQVQLTELVPNNPYMAGVTMNPGAQGVPAYYNSDGSPMTGSVPWGDDWRNHLQAQNNQRVLLSINYSITAPQIDQWAKDPPEDWVAAPGTISAVGNNQGLFLVWGAGADGKPIKNLFNGNTLIITGRTYGNVNDQTSANQY